MRAGCALTASAKAAGEPGEPPFPLSGICAVSSAVSRYDPNPLPYTGRVTLRPDVTAVGCSSADCARMSAFVSCGHSSNVRFSSFGADFVAKVFLHWRSKILLAVDATLYAN
jgi:hypothetical protein